MYSFFLALNVLDSLNRDNITGSTISSFDNILIAIFGKLIAMLFLKKISINCSNIVAS